MKAGDVLSHIASNHQTTVTAICRENKLTTDRIVVGQKLRIPVTGAQKAASQSAKRVNSLPVKKLAKHKVQSGETLHSIAKLHNLSIDSLKASNPDVEPTKMHVGQILLLDRRAQQPSSNGLSALSSSKDVKASPASASVSKSLAIMSRRLWYIITWPSAILASVFAIWLLILMPEWLYQSWMLIKIGFILLLYAYHLKTHQMFLQLQRDEIKYSSNFMRIWNEGATLFLFAIIFLAIVKSAIHWIFMVLGTLGLIVFLMLAIKLYKRLREKSTDNGD